VWERYREEMRGKNTRNPKKQTTTRMPNLTTDADESILAGGAEAKAEQE
jgi:hypothetical protein